VADRHSLTQFPIRRGSVIKIIKQELRNEI
jgi:hypothetical protein